MDNMPIIKGTIPSERVELILSMHSDNNFARLLGIKITALGEGFCRLSMEPGGVCANPYGGVHGGVTATLADIAMGIAIRALGLQPVTLELTVNYLGSVQPGEELTAEGRVIHRGRTFQLSESEIYTAGGTVVARGRGLFTIRKTLGNN